MLNVDRYQLNARAVTDIHALEPLHQLALNRHVEQPYPCAFGGRARDQGIELLPDSRSKEKRGSGCSNPAFYFVDDILFLCAMLRQHPQFIVAIRRCSPFYFTLVSMGDPLSWKTLSAALRSAGCKRCPPRGPLALAAARACAALWTIASVWSYLSCLPLGSTPVGSYDKLGKDDHGHESTCPSWCSFRSTR